MTIDATARPPARPSLSLPFLIYLNFAILLPVGWFQNGFPRLVLLLVFGGGMLACLAFQRGFALLEAALARIGTFWRVILFEAIPVMVLVFSLNSPNKVRIWEALIVAMLVGALLWRDGVVTSSARQSAIMRWFGWGLLALALSVPLLNLASGLLVPKLSDVATTTVDAAQMVMQGRNPYAASLDPYGVDNAHDPAFGGYKYLPLMILFHLPFVMSLGPMAMLWANVLLLAGLCAVVWGLSRSKTGALDGADNRLVVLAVLLVTPELAETALAMGYNDVAGTVLVLAAFLLRGRSALLAGLLVGCSLSFKLMPGLAAATILFPPERWRPYVTGMILGLLPSALFILWDWQAFTRNVLLFNLVRSPDPTSWRLFAPFWLGRAVGLAALAVWLGGSAWLALRGSAALDRERPDARLILFMIAALLLIMTGSTAHDDYMIWWMPAALAAFARKSEEQMPMATMRLAAAG